MADINNLTGLEKPLTKLVETISEGLGVVGNAVFQFDAKKLKRIGEAQSEVNKLKIVKTAEGEAKALGIMQRASNRFALEQYNKQTNLENIVVKSRQMLDGATVSDTPVDKDWTARFLGIAQDVSREDMQDVLAKILANEVASPSTYSLRTLDLIRNLSSAELKAFTGYVGMAMQPYGVIILSKLTLNSLKNYDLKIDEYIQLTDIGLFNSNTTLNVNTKLKKDKSVLINIAKEDWLITNHDEEEKELLLDVIKYTEAGVEIAGLLTEFPVNTKRDVYLRDIKESIVSQGFSVS